MRIPILITIIAAIVIAALLTAGGSLFINPNTSLIADAGFDLETITPNADGDSDVTNFSYTLSRNAIVTISLANESGETFMFREAQRRAVGDYGVTFSGVVDGYILPGETIEGEVERRLIPNGVYTWTLAAEGVDREENQSVTGTLTVTDADSPLPLMTDFSVSPEVFTPNQDGVQDRVLINVAVAKEAAVSAYLVDENGVSLPIPQRIGASEVGEPERYEFDYEGGVDLGAEPPPDGTYTVYVEAQDAVGQRIQRSATLMLQNGGKPRAEIVSQPIGADVLFAIADYEDRYFSSKDGMGDLIAMPEEADGIIATSISLPLNDLLIFKLTVENYGATPIRTSGPPPGTVYQQDQLAAAMGEYEQPGVWRVGLQCETSQTSYPWRWGLGTAETLVTEQDPTNDNVYLYLMPGERVVVWGAVRMTEIVDTRNPQTCYAGLIHEGVEVSLQNMVVGPRAVMLAEE